MYIGAVSPICVTIISADICLKNIYLIKDIFSITDTFNCLNHSDCVSVLNIKFQLQQEFIILKLLLYSLFSVSLSNCGFLKKIMN